MLESGIRDSGVFEGLLVLACGVVDLGEAPELERSVAAKWRPDVEAHLKATPRIANLKGLVECLVSESRH
jgi:hypothetical protein